MDKDTFFITINKREVPARKGERLLEVCLREGVSIPTLCYLHRGKDDEKLPAAAGGPHTSCMVCVVEDALSGELLPSCSALCRPGMCLSSDTPKVSTARREALELLLSEHVGECYSPCRLLCPDNLPIPQILRLLTEGQAAQAISLLLSTAPFRCENCQAPCERVCRRRQVDRSVEIKQLFMRALDTATGGLERPGAWPRRPGGIDPPKPPDRSFLSIRKTTDRDLFDPPYAKGRESEPLSPCTQGGATLRDSSKIPCNDISGGAEDLIEAERCLDCDCLKADSCGLKILAAAYGAKPRRFAGEHPDLPPRVRRGEEFCYEPGKCIKCGICVAVTRGGPGEFIFSGKGYNLTVIVPEGGDLSWAVRTAAPLCPTGALALDTHRKTGGGA